MLIEYSNFIITTLLMLICLGICVIIVSIWRLSSNFRSEKNQIDLGLQEFRLQLEQHKKTIITELQDRMHQQHIATNKQLADSLLQVLTVLQERMQDGLTQTRTQVNEILQTHNKLLTNSVEKLTQIVESRLETISGKVEKRLSDGFEKTTATFTDIIKRLALIDEAQKKIAELSGNVISLQSVLDDKRSRGAFGEVQLENIIRNMIPPQHFSFQHTLENGKRADCILILPEPTGNIAIDAKFPLECYRRLQDKSLAESDRKLIQQQFRVDIKRHVQDIAEKYIRPPETSDGAMMFIPAEAIFAEIHAEYPEIVEYAQSKSVWMVSPTTMMAILTTARAVLKDAATRKQVHIIREHLIKLATDFQRFDKRMDNLAKHIRLANDDVSEVNKSAKKLTMRFEKIEKVDLQETPLLEES